MALPKRYRPPTSVTLGSCGGVAIGVALAAAVMLTIQ
jgi:hypothetical protein